MIQLIGDRPWAARLGDRLAARRLGWSREAASLAAMPEPHSIGDLARGRALAEGRIGAGDAATTLPEGATIFQPAAPSMRFEAARQAFDWLPDLAAQGDSPARAAAQAWTADWLARFGAGHGPGWTPGLAGLRLIRLLDHTPWLLSGGSPLPEEDVMRSLHRHAAFLERRWSSAAGGAPRLAALAGLAEASAMLAGWSPAGARAGRALDAAIAADLDAWGGLPDRNPVTLLEVFALLVRVTDALRRSNHRPGAALKEALARMAASLRYLRHADGALPRFHGGGRGQPGRLDAALVASGVPSGSPAEPTLRTAATGRLEAPGLRAPPPRTRPPRARPTGSRSPGPRPPAAEDAATPLLPLGYARLARGRTTVLADVAAPPKVAGHAPHASTLAFELTSGRRPLVVTCGPGAAFGADWAAAARQRASASTLSLDTGGPALPDDVQVDVAAAEEAPSLVAAHNGFAAATGLIHVRRLDLSADGRRLDGEDLLTAVTARERRQLEDALKPAGGSGLPFALRFHLHPDVAATLEDGGRSMTLRLRSGEMWEFRHAGAEAATLEESVYLEPARGEPLPARQIVLTGAAKGPTTRIAWVLAKSAATPDHMRDLRRADPRETTDPREDAP